MILHIQKKDRTAFLRACTHFGVVVDFLTDEKVDTLCFAQVHTEDAATAYYIGREFEKIVREEEDIQATTDNLFDLFKIKMP